jgi:HAD superfamily hydrolase (TIGR01509 family)
VTPDDPALQRQRVAATVQEWAARPGRGVIFDFNGTLSDDEPLLMQIFTEIFAARLGWDMSPAEYRDRLLGHSDREIVQIAVDQHADGDAATTEELLAQRRRRYKELVAERSPITTEATALVRRLDAAAVPMAIVTGAQREDVMAVLDRCEVGRRIDLLVTEEDVRMGKPDPEGFLRGAALLARRPEDILVFEDSVPGVMGAKRAGMSCVAVAGATPNALLHSVAPAVTGKLGPHLLEPVRL